MIDEFTKLIESFKNSRYERIKDQNLRFTEDIDLIIPNINNTLNIVSVIKGNLLTLKYRSDKSVPVSLITNFDMNVYYFKMLNECMPEDSSSYEISNADISKIAKCLLCNKHSIRYQVI